MILFYSLPCPRNCIVMFALSFQARHSKLYHNFTVTATININISFYALSLTEYNLKLKFKINIDIQPQ